MAEEAPVAEVPVEPTETASNEGDNAPQDNASQADPEQPEHPLPGRKRKAKADGEAAVKKPRCNFLDKAFDDLTMADVDKLVRRCNNLEKQVEVNAEAAQQLSEMKAKNKSLEKEMDAIDSDEVARVKAAICKQLHGQMHWNFQWNAEIKDGRGITAFVPNVSADMLKALGGTPGQTTKKQTERYFEKAPSKSVTSTRKNEQPLGSTLVLGSWLHFKWVKCNNELQVESTYKFEVKKKKQVRSKKAGAAEDAEEAEAEDQEAGNGEEGEADAPMVEALAVGGQ